MTLVLTTVLAGCGKDNGKETQAVSSKDYVYSEEFLDFGLDSDNQYLAGTDLEGDRILAVVTRYEDTPIQAREEAVEVTGEEVIVVEEATETVEVTEEIAKYDEYGTEGSTFVTFKQFDLSGQPISEFEWEYGYDANFMGATLDGNGNVFFIYTEYGATENENGELTDAYYVKGYSESGEELFNIQIGNEVEEGEWYYINSIDYLANGQICIHSTNGIELVNADGTYDKVISFEALESYSVLENKDGNLCVLCYGDTGLDVYTVDMTAGKINQEAMQLPFNLGNYTLYGGNDCDLYLSDMSGIYTYNFGDANVKKIMDFIDSDIATTTLSGVSGIDETHFFGCRYDEASEQQAAAIYTKVAPEDVPDKETIVLAGNWIDHSIRMRAVDFNKANEQYRISVVDYSQYNTQDDYSLGMERLNSDIVAGNVPDIIYATSEMRMENYINKGLLADLNTFIENDPEIKREDYFENVFDIFSKDGKLYQVTPSYYVFSVYGKTADVGETPGWTMDELNALKEKKGPEVEIFSETTASSVILYSMIFGGAEYIDWETGECSFDSKDFIDLLTFAKQFPAEIDYSVMEYDEAYWASYETMYREGRALLMASTISDFTDFNIIEKGTFGEDVTLIGFPNEEKQSGAIAANTSFSISAKSDYQDGAWQFVRYYLTDEYQSNVDYGFPLKKSAMEAKAAEARKKPSYEDENGQLVEYDNTYYLNGQEIIIPPMTQEETDELIQYISSIQKKYTYNEDISNILNEECAPYFAGQKQAEEVADIVQSRVQIYVNENR